MRGPCYVQRILLTSPQEGFLHTSSYNCHFKVNRLDFVWNENCKHIKKSNSIPALKNIIYTCYTCFLFSFLLDKPGDSQWQNDSGLIPGSVLST